MSNSLVNMKLDGPVSVIELSLPASLDAEEFDRLNQLIQDAVNETPRGKWVVDLQAAEYVGSAVLGLLVNVRQQIKQASGRLVLCGLSERMLEVFHTCSLERLFQVRPTRDEAMQAAMR